MYPHEHQRARIPRHRHLSHRSQNRIARAMVHISPEPENRPKPATGHYAGNVRGCSTQTHDSSRIKTKHKRPQNANPEHRGTTPNKGERHRTSPNNTKQVITCKIGFFPPSGSCLMARSIVDTHSLRREQFVRSGLIPDRRRYLFEISQRTGCESGLARLLRESSQFVSILGRC